MEMSTMTIAVLCIVALVLAIVIGSIKKINIGILALIFAYIIGCVLMGKFASTVTTLFPVKIMMYLLTVAYFYGFAISNGTMQAIGDNIIYAFRNHAKLLPWAIFLGSAVIAGAGGGGLMANIVMAPIAFSLAKRAKFSPLLAYLAVVIGSPLGGTTFWSVGGVSTRSIAESSGIENAPSLVPQQTATLAITSISFMIILYIVLKGFKIQNVDIQKPAPMTKEQSITLKLIIGVIVLVVVPALINIIAPNAVLRYLVNFVFEIQLLSLIGGVICTLLKLGDGRKIITTQIPWNMILVICGVGTLIAVASNNGVITMVAESIGQNISPRAATILMTTIGGVMSFVSDGMGVCMPTFYPLMNELAASAGIAIGPMFLGFTTAIWATGASPISSGGGLALSNADETIRDKVFVQAIIAVVCYCAWTILLSVLGVFSMFG